MFLRLSYAAIDDLVIHDLSALSTQKILLSSAHRQVSPRRSETTRSQRHGIVDRTRLYGAQVIDLAGIVKDDDDAVVQSTMDELAGALALGDPHVLTFRRIGMPENEQVEVIAGTDLGNPAQGFDRWPKWSISLVGADPRVYTAVLRSATYDPTTAITGGGAEMPLVFPLVFATSTLTQLQCVVGGTFWTPPTLTITGPVTNPIVDNDLTGESIYTVSTLSLGINDTLVLDVANTRCLLNGVSRPDLIDAGPTTWFQLKHRLLNPLRLRGAAMVTDLTSLTAQYRDARI